MTKAQKRRVQRLRSLEQAEEEYLRQLKKIWGIMQIPSLCPERNLIWKWKPQPDVAETSTKPASAEPAKQDAREGSSRMVSDDLSNDDDDI